MRVANNLVRAGTLIMFTCFIPVSGSVWAQESEKEIDRTTHLVVMLRGKFPDEVETFGAGIIFGKHEEEVYVVTANHVVRRGGLEATKLHVTLKSRPDQVLNAKLLKNANSELDVAVLALIRK